ncbi:hypothetical protein [Dyella sp. S184]|uniref:hypothetical protein n=1 Tax=Dyella sp. S184 TaxID=1641862 RepID=UPI00131A9CDE|nr:hypothetical protein [Dyella sp. S184]
MTQRSTKKRYWLYVLGIVTGLSGLVITLVYFSDFLVRLFGIFMTLGGAYLVRISRAPSLVRSSETTANSSYLVSVNRTRRRWVWFLGAISLVASGISFAFMYKDALDGYNHAWPLYAFALSMAVFALTSSYLVGIFVRNLFSR